ncbi:hypothetical protein [Frigoriglobus tundricola]|uniref:Uncharacterized protein n=1 Tax=Frigoriglobus tundricola TaxID=2774151 RepID=A0A6M5YJ11_9BACT|nr:hypothetical protein [Frigoriglobus tundricola]QJW94037.1 hypothetical protein FTUN_1556 [Frigoriglobus tundricola]
MHRFSTVPAALIGLTTIFAVGALAAPARTHAVGWDLWHFADEWTSFRDAETAAQDLDFGLEQARRREVVCDDIAISLCEDRITLDEAIKDIGAFADSSPDWIVQLRAVYSGRGDVAPTATDREVLARYLRARIKSLIGTAEAVGDTARATALSARLTRFDREAREHPGSAPAPQTRR